MKLSISILGLLSIESFHQHHVVVSGFQIQPPNQNLAWKQALFPSVVPVTTLTRTTTTTPCQPHSQTCTALYIFGGLFGGGSSSKLILSEEPLTIYSIPAKADDGDDKDKQYVALGEYIEKWSQLFTNGNIKLTTPVTVELVKVPETSHRGVRLLFKDTNTGYQSRTEEQESNSRPKATANGEGAQSTDKKKKGKVKQGGVEILVEKDDKGVQVTAKRCEVEEDTIIKEMSEETILNELKQAIEVWKRETKQ